MSATVAHDPSLGSHTPSYNSYSMNPSSSSSQPTLQATTRPLGRDRARPLRRKPPVNLDEFYKNVSPQDIIVIDSDDNADDNDSSRSHDNLHKYTINSSTSRKHGYTSLSDGDNEENDDEGEIFHDARDYKRRHPLKGAGNNIYAKLAVDSSSASTSAPASATSSATSSVIGDNNDSYLSSSQSSLFEYSSIPASSTVSMLTPPGMGSLYYTTTSHNDTSTTLTPSLNYNQNTNKYTGNLSTQPHQLSSESQPNVKRRRKQRTPKEKDLNEINREITYYPPQHPIHKIMNVDVVHINDLSVPKAIGTAEMSLAGANAGMITDINVAALSPMESTTPSYDDADGHYVITPGHTFANRFVIKQMLGQGTFGKVISAYDRLTNTYCAIKIIRAVPKYRDAAKIELRVLKMLSTYDQTNHNRCIHLRECFDYRNHICIVTDLLGISVFDFLKLNNFLPFPAHHIRILAKQLLISVAFLHDLNLVHTDLKPENILLVNSESTTMKNCDIPGLTKNSKALADGKATSDADNQTTNVLKDTRIRLIDFGSAVFDDEYHSSIVSTRHYRAPEIIFGLPWSKPIDIWSVGCILVEFFTGEALFQTHDNLEHLALIETIINKKFSVPLVQEALKTKTSEAFFNPKTKKLLYPNETTKRSSKKYVKGRDNLSKIFQQVTKDPNSDPKLRKFWSLFMDLLPKMFVYDAKNRITAKEALDHPWFSFPL
ncbi:kinase-like protein [Nadsonia fulvescens var. elongata DSM 6958]|uniref:Kinase-like protein n=1 Tax=Nadsonia fulvescens var. elongata DSM 6958 TaxID=857566 RepID=A0A1E3PM63_9ASCO|nr:kinase-like protein [Nadsonia fulvescens var. elongata DSM 6958]